MIRTEITSLDQLQEILEISKTEKVLIFKHSTRCGVSRMALRSFEAEAQEKGLERYFYLDLLANRNISNKIAEEFGVVHQSPQLIVLKDGEVLKHSSHHQITI